MDLKSYQQILAAENNIVERGHVTNEDLCHLLEYRPWILRALSEYMGFSPSGLRNYISENEFYAVDYFCALVKHRTQYEPRVSFFHGDVIYE